MIREKRHAGETGRKFWELIFVVYIVVLIKLIIFKYPWQSLMEIINNWEKGVILEGILRANFTLGKSIRMYIRYFNKFPFWNGFANLIGNVLVFVPYGVILPKAYPGCGKWWRAVYCSVGLVMSIELFQLFSGFGIFDIDDILLNVSGAMLGYGLFVILREIKIRSRIRKIIKNGKR